MRNPYYISFGKIPNQYLTRKVLIDEIVETLLADPIQEQAFKLTGLRGTGKTVTLTAIEREIENEDDWTIIDLISDSKMLNDLLSKLYDKNKSIADYVNTELDLSKFGIGISVSKEKSVESISYALEKIFERVKKKKQRVLITIDEARKTQEMVVFLQEIQKLMRKEYPVFIIITGLYEDIEKIENTDGLTFIYRAEKREMMPLNLTSMAANYKENLDITYEVAQEMAYITKGYAFCYQALGKYMWDAHATSITDEVLANLDEALRDMVYDKLWSELSATERKYLAFICQKDKMNVSELLELTKSNHSAWSVPRHELVKKGLIDTSSRGEIVSKLPRFMEYLTANHSEDLLQK